MKKVAVTIVFVLALSLTVSGKEKKTKPWTQWSGKEAQKILNDSPWGQTQVEADISEMFYTPTSSRSSAARGERGAFNQSIPLNFRIRLLSAKPIRQAFARLIESQQKVPNKQLSDSLQSFVERKFDQYIVVTVDYDSPTDDRRVSGPVMQMFNSSIADVLRNNTYIETKNGKRLFLQDYKPPAADGLGAKFIFARLVDGQPFLEPDSGELRFYSDLSSLAKGLVLNMRFKLSDMMYEGILEY